MNEKEMMKQMQDLRASMKEEDANAFLVQVAKMAEVFYTSAIALTSSAICFRGRSPRSLKSARKGTMIGTRMTSNIWMPPFSMPFPARVCS